MSNSNIASVNQTQKKASTDQVCIHFDKTSQALQPSSSMKGWIPASFKKETNDNDHGVIKTIPELNFKGVKAL